MPASIPDSDAGRFCQSQRGAARRRVDHGEEGVRRDGAVRRRQGLHVPEEGTLVVKIPGSQAGELIAAARAERFHPGYGRASATWAAVFTSASDRWPRLAREARALAAG